MVGAVGVGLGYDKQYYFGPSPSPHWTIDFFLFVFNYLFNYDWIRKGSGGLRGSKPGTYLGLAESGITDVESHFIMVMVTVCTCRLRV